MGSPEDQKLLQAAFHSGLLQPSQVEKIRRHIASVQENGSSSVLQILKNMGLTSRQQDYLLHLIDKGYGFCSSCHKIWVETSRQNCSQCGQILDMYLSSTSSSPSSSPAKFHLQSPGQYRSLKQLGRGGYGSVYRVEDSMGQRTVALKILHKEHHTKFKIRQRFLREIRITSLLEHPGIIPVYESGQLQDGSYYFTMKELAGETLKDWLIPGPKGQRRREIDEYLEIFLKICQAVEYAHSQGVIHRDLKPDNVALHRFGEVIVLDWGIARVKEEKDLERDFSWEDFEGEEREDDLTLEGMMGTPGYMPPEQIKGGEVGPRSDVFSLGAILYQILTLQPPFTGKAQERLYQTLHHPPPSPEEIRGEPLAPELTAIALKALEKDPGQRYPSVEDLRRDVERYRGGFAIRGQRQSLWQRSKKWILRHRYHLGGAALVLLALIMGFVALAIVEKSRNQEEVNAYLKKARQARKAPVLTRLSKLTKEKEGRPEELSRLRQQALKICLEARDYLERALKVSPHRREIKEELIALENQIGQLSLAERNFLLSQTALRRIRDLGAEKVARELARDIEAKEGEIEKSHRAQIREIMEVLAQGPPPPRMADEYVTEIVALPSKYAVEEVMKYLDHQKFWPRKVAIEALGKLGDGETKWQGKDAVERLMDRLEKLNPKKDIQEAEAIIWALGRLRDSRAWELVWKTRLKMGERSAFFRRTSLPFQRIPRPSGQSLADQKKLEKNILKEAKVKYLRQNWAGAIVDYTRVLAKRSPTYEIYLQRGSAYLNLDKRGEALADFNRALKLNPQGFEALSNRGLILKRKKKFSAALKDFNLSLAINPSQAITLNHRGQVYYHLGKYQKALKDYNRALEINDEFTLAYVHRGQIWLKLERLKSAYQDFTRAISLNPHQAHAYLNRAVIYIKKKQFQMARKDLELALTNNPRLDMAYVHRGVIDSQEGHWKEALKSYNQALELNEKNQTAYSNRGILYFQRGQLQKALADFRRAMELNASNVDFYRHYALALGRVNQEKKALKMFEKALEIDPQNPNVYNDRGFLLERMGKVRAALANYNQCLKLNSHHLVALNNRGMLFYSQNRFDLALSNFSKALDIDANYVPSLASRGAVYYRMGKGKKALRDFSRALKLNPRHKNARKGRAFTYGKLGQTGKAIADLEAYLKFHPQAADANQVRGLIRRWKGGN